MLFSGLHRNTARCISLQGKSCKCLHQDFSFMWELHGYLMQCLCHAVSRIQRFSEIMTFLYRDNVKQFWRAHLQQRLQFCGQERSRLHSQANLTWEWWLQYSLFLSSFQNWGGVWGQGEDYWAEGLFKYHIFCHQLFTWFSLFWMFIPLL